MELFNRLSRAAATGLVALVLSTQPSQAIQPEAQPKPTQNQVQPKTHNFKDFLQVYEQSYLDSQKQSDKQPTELTKRQTKELSSYWKSLDKSEKQDVYECFKNPKAKQKELEKENQELEDYLRDEKCLTLDDVRYPTFKDYFNNTEELTPDVIGFLNNDNSYGWKVDHKHLKLENPTNYHLSQMLCMYTKAMENWEMQDSSTAYKCKD